MLRKVVASAEDIDFQSVRVQRVKPVPFDWSLDDKRLVKLFKPFVEGDPKNLRPQLSVLHYNGTFLAATDGHTLAVVPIPSSMRKKFGEPGSYFLPELHTPKRYEKIGESLKLERDSKRTEQDRYPNVPAVFPHSDIIASKGQFSPYTLLTYLKAVEPFVKDGGKGKAIIVKVNNVEWAFDPDYMASGLKFMLQLGFDKLYFHAQEETNRPFVISATSKLPSINGSLDIDPMKPSPRKPTMKKNLGFERDTAFLIMPKGINANNEVGYGVFNSKKEKYVTAYYDFTKDAIIDEGKVVKIDPFSKPSLIVKKTALNDLQAKIIKQLTSRNKEIEALTKVYVSQKTLYADDLSTQYILPNFDSKPDGLYDLNGKSLVREKDVDINEFPETIKKEDISNPVMTVSGANLLSLLELSHNINDIYQDVHTVFFRDIDVFGERYAFLLGTDKIVLHLIAMGKGKPRKNLNLPYIEAYKTLRGKGLKDKRLTLHKKNNETDKREHAIVGLTDENGYLAYKEPTATHIKPDLLENIVSISTQYKTGLVVDKNKLIESLEEAVAWTGDELEITWWDYNSNGDQFLYKLDGDKLDELRSNSLKAEGEQAIPDLIGFGGPPAPEDSEILINHAAERGGEIVMYVSKKSTPFLISALKRNAAKNIYIQKSSKTFTFFAIPQRAKQQNTPNVKTAKAKAKAQKQRIRLLAMAS